MWKMTPAPIGTEPSRRPQTGVARADDTRVDGVHGDGAGQVGPKKRCDPRAKPNRRGETNKARADEPRAGSEQMGSEQNEAPSRPADSQFQHHPRSFRHRASCPAAARDLMRLAITFQPVLPVARPCGCSCPGRGRKDPGTLADHGARAGHPATGCRSPGLDPGASTAGQRRGE